MRLSELNQDQRGHLAWRLDHNTCCGRLTAGAVARGDHGDLDIVEIFKTYGDRSERSAKILAGKVRSFVLDPMDKEAKELIIRLRKTPAKETNGFCL